MALTKLTNDLNIIQALANRIRGQAATVKAKFDEGINTIKNYINNTLTTEIDALDAQNVKLTGDQTIAGVKTFSSSPIVPTPTADLQTATKKYVDDNDTTHRNELALTDGVGGSNLIGTPAITGVSGTTVKSQLASLKSVIDQTVLGQIPDGSLTDVKLSNDSTEIKQRFASHLADTAAHNLGNTVSNVRVLLRDMLRIKMRQTGLNLDPNAWSDTLENASGINTGASSNYALSGGVLKSVYDAYTKTLLHFNGINGSTTFTDELGRIWTAYDNAQINTTQSKFGGASGYFDGSGDYVETADSTDWDFGSGDFTIDFWVMFSALPANPCLLVNQWNVGDTASSAWTVQYGSDSFTIAVANGSTAYSASYSLTPTLNTWYHVAAVRTGNTIKIAINGTFGTDTEFSLSVNDAELPLRIGKEAAYTTGGVSDFNGYIDELRISKGIARWTANFTPPASEYTKPDATVVWNAQTSEGTLINAIVEAIETLGTGTITYYISRDGGITYTQCTLDTATSIASQPSGTSIVLKVVITGNAELLAVAWGGEV